MDNDSVRRLQLIKMTMQNDNPFDPKTGAAIADMINAFLRWPLPESVRCDPCCMDTKAKNRTGTNLMSVTEAMQMMQEVVCPIIAKHSPPSPVAQGEEQKPLDAFEVNNLATYWEGMRDEWQGRADSLKERNTSAAEGCASRAETFAACAQELRGHLKCAQLKSAPLPKESEREARLEKALREIHKAAKRQVESIDPHITPQWVQMTAEEALTQST